MAKSNEFETVNIPRVGCVMDTRDDGLFVKFYAIKLFPVWS